MSNVHDATKELNPSEKGFDSIDIAGSVGREAVLIVSESGLYQMIFESRSRKPETKKFIRWITSLVLPAIRRYRLGHLKQLEAEDRQNREAIGRIKAELEVIDNRLAAHLVMRRPDYPDFFNPGTLINENKEFELRNQNFKQIENEYNNNNIK